MRYREQLPQLDGRLFMTDGGLETTLIFHDGFDLPEFAAVDLLRSKAGTEALRSYYARYAELRSRARRRFRAREPDVAGESGLGGCGSATPSPSSMP